MVDFLISILDYIIMFAIIFVASFGGVLMALLVVIRAAISTLSKRAGYNYQAGRHEYMNEQERAYSRKQV